MHKYITALLPTVLTCMLISGSAISNQLSPICKEGTIKVKLINNICYDYDQGKSTTCLKSFKPELYQARYEYYIFNAEGKITGTGTKTIQPNVVTTICKEKEFKGEKLYAIIITNYGGGPTYTTIPNAIDNVVIQPVVDKYHPGSNAVFCKSSFTPGTKGEFCSISNASNIIK